MSRRKSTDPDRIFRHIVIEAVTPTVDCGRYPAKRIAGESCVVEADIFGDGPAALAAVIKWRRALDEGFAELPMVFIDNDRWRGEFTLAENTRYDFAIEAWTRAFTSWRDYFMKKTAAGLEVASDLAEGIALLETIRKRACGDEHTLIADHIAQLRALNSPAEAVAIVSAPEPEAAADRNEEGADAVNYDCTSAIVADRRRARFGAWYEIFLRSQRNRPGPHANLREAEARLHDIRDMGFRRRISHSDPSNWRSPIARDRTTRGSQRRIVRAAREQLEVPPEAIWRLSPGSARSAILITSSRLPNALGSKLRSISRSNARLTTRGSLSIRSGSDIAPTAV